MKIMFFSLSLSGGGAERVLACLSNELVKKNDVVMTTLRKENDHYRLDKRVKRIQIDKRNYNQQNKLLLLWKKVSFIRLIKLVRYIKTERPDVVVTFLPLPSIYIMMAKVLSRKVRKTPVILSERGDPDKEYHSKVLLFLIKKLYGYADGFVFQTSEAGVFYSDFLKCKTSIIENPINAAFMGHPCSKKRKKTVVSCGRLEAQKNYEILIGAFSDVVQQYPEYSLEIYGEGSQKEHLIEYATKLNVANKVFFKGRVNDLANKIKDSGVFVLSSDYEGMPNALMEAMALGLPCVSTDCPVGGPKALIKNGENGLLVKVRDKTGLSDAIIDIVSDRELASKLSTNGAKTARAYTAEKISARWESFIFLVLQQKGAR